MVVLIISSPDEEQIFIEIYNKYYKYVYSISLTYLKRPALAEENLQDVFLYIVDYFQKFTDYDSKEFKSLLSIITSAKAKNYYTYNVRHNPQEVCDITCSSTPYKSSFDMYDVVALKAAINDLSEEYRLPLILKYAYGFKSKEIARLLNVSDSLVRKRIQLAKIKLQKEMEE